MRAVILAGGRGTRLAPYTAYLPKPLMPVGDMPILEILLRQLKGHGITRVTLSVGHLSSLLRAYFGDGERIGLPIEYSQEAEPLGTAGPLSLLSDLNEPFLLMNGDLLTDIDYTALLAFHRACGAFATVGVYRRSVNIDLGVVEVGDNHCITGYIEKPSYDFRVSMGLYVFQPEVAQAVPPHARLDLPDLVLQLLARGDYVAAYEHTGYWLDIGRPDDYARAQQDFEADRFRFTNHDATG